MRAFDGKLQAPLVGRKHGSALVLAALGEVLSKGTASDAGVDERNNSAPRPVTEIGLEA
jgi:hypothetical protein